jgi:hypothetical protein
MKPAHEELEEHLDGIVRRSSADLDRLRPDYDLYRTAAGALQAAGVRGTKHRVPGTFEEWVRDLLRGNLRRS